MAIKKAVAFIDAAEWPVFKDHLERAGMRIKNVIEVREQGVLSVMIHTTDVAALEAVLRAAKEQASQTTLRLS